jgi:predicted PurR-regulated permease PerM
MTEDRFRRAFLLVLVVAITVAFLAILRPFLMTILVASIFAGLVYPVYRRLVIWLRGRRPAAAGLTLLLMVVVVVLPLAGLLGVVVNQAIRVTGSVAPVVERFLAEPTQLDSFLERIPGFEHIEPYRAEIVTRAGDVVGAVGTFLIGSLSSTTRGTVAFVFNFFVVLYTMFFLLLDGPGQLRRILSYLPLTEDDTERVKDRFISVTRATLKGTVIIGIIQGVLSGVAFWAVGIPDVVFWTVIMIVLSILPVIGGALVWVPAAIILAISGEMIHAIALVVFCALIVGSVDNLLRPRLVGRDTKLPDLVILFSTFGGIFAFGAVGFIVGPILAGLFVTIWEIFGSAYRDVIHPETGPIEPEPIVDLIEPAPVPVPEAEESASAVSGDVQPGNQSS